MNEITIENNCTLAWFLTDNNENGIIEEYYLPQLSTYDNGEDWILKQHLLFHNNWNWIELVLDKIQSLGYIVSIKSDCDRSEIHIYDYDEDAEVVSYVYLEDINKLRGVNQACVEFIKQYNGDI